MSASQASDIIGLLWAILITLCGININIWISGRRR